MLPSAGQSLPHPCVVIPKYGKAYIFFFCVPEFVVLEKDNPLSQMY